MKRMLSIILLVVVVFVTGMAGCQLNQPDFEDFQEYEDDFALIKDFIIESDFSRNGASPLIVDINSQFLTIDGDEISDSSIENAVNAIHDKGFTYIEINDDCVVFWGDETGYYGVLWSLNPKESINNIIEGSRPYMKSRKLAKEWYEVGALDSI